MSQRLHRRGRAVLRDPLQAGQEAGQKPSKPGTPPTEPGGTPPTEPGGGTTPTAEPGGVNPDESEQPVTPGAAPHEDDGLVFIDVARCATLGVIVDG
ncbi:hypothetical protein [Nannocystis pusilla]|uniref:hypothetical protein n=1 Tax=Nannocystis pusilla TaxID=889268 RepID=UPI003B8216C2